MAPEGAFLLSWRDVPRETMTVENIVYNPAGPVVTAFHVSNAFVRGLMGPVGSSKSSACFWELLNRGFQQEPYRGRRRVKHVVIRQTYPELKSTTIETCLAWMPMMKMSWDAPITGMLTIPLPDKTISEQEFTFLAIERPDDVKKLKSFEATDAWLNEAAEIHFEVFTKAIERVGRWPKEDKGGITRDFVIADTNPPDTDSWWYKFFEQKKFEIRKTDGTPIEVAVFKQPGGLKETKEGTFVPNDGAENIQNLKGGYDYYLKQLLRPKDEIRVFLCGKYGVVTSGKPVYPEYNDDLHCRKTEKNPLLPLILGWDFGLAGNAVAVCQLTKRGQLLVLDEVCSTDIGLHEFAETCVKPFLAMNYPKYDLRSVGDPAGMHRSTNEAKTCFQTLAEVGFAIMPALSNDPMARIEAVRRFLNSMSDGQPRFSVDPAAQTLRKGLLGKYCFERVQVTGPERYRDKPAKNEYSHIADALGYAAMHVSHVELSSWKSDKRQLYVPMAIA